MKLKVNGLLLLAGCAFVYEEESTTFTIRSIVAVKEVEQSRASTLLYYIEHDAVEA